MKLPWSLRLLGLSFLVLTTVVVWGFWGVDDDIDDVNGRVDALFAPEQVETTESADATTPNVGTLADGGVGAEPGDERPHELDLDPDETIVVHRPLGAPTLIFDPVTEELTPSTSVAVPSIVTSLAPDTVPPDETLAPPTAPPTTIAPPVAVPHNVLNDVVIHMGGNNVWAASCSDHELESVTAVLSGESVTFRCQ